jgi:uncharacterized protein YqhQ
MFTKLYLDTTNPKITWKEIIQTNIWIMIIISVLFHTVVYSIFINVVYFIFSGKFLSNIINIRLVSVLLLIMFFGYIGRIIHVKEIYKTFHNNEKVTRDFTNQIYVTWTFLG